MKKLARIHRSNRKHWVGNGFPVQSVFDYKTFGEDLSPFLLFDYAAPQTFPPGNTRRGVGTHPHKGFETVTLVYQGELEHSDSSGGGGKIEAGDVQWMTAGRGIVHEEYHSKGFTQSGGTLQMIQLWVNLLAKDKNAPPAYQKLAKEDIPVATLSNEAGTVRIIAGHYGEVRGPARTFTPIQLWDVSARADKVVELPLQDGHTTALFILNGEIALDSEQLAREGDLALFGRDGENVRLRAVKESTLLVMSGQPLGEPIVGYGPFVMNTTEEIQEARQAFGY